MVELRGFYFVLFAVLNLKGQPKAPDGRSIPHLASMLLVFQLLPHSHKASVCILHPQNQPWL